MSPPCRLYSGELGWISYLSNILSPSLAKKWRVKKFSVRFARRIPLTFETVAPPLWPCDKPVRYFSEKKRRYGFEPAKEMPAWHIVSYQPWVYNSRPMNTSLATFKNILRHSYSANTMALSWNSDNTVRYIFRCAFIILNSDMFLLRILYSFIT